MKLTKGSKSPSSKEIARLKENPFDYLTSLKENGRAAVVHDNLEDMGKSAAKLIQSMDVQTETNIAKTIRDLVDSKVVIPKDMKIDDGDLPVANNFYEWVTEDRFGTIGDERPFLDQLTWGLIAFNDVCYNPKCTDLEWLLVTHKVDDTYSKLERKVSILQKGVCPNCGMGRSDAVRKGIAPFYNELAINAGQRCVIGTTPVITEFGILHIDEVCNDVPYGFAPMEKQIHNGERFETTSHSFRAEPEPVIRVETDAGFSVTGTLDHPIYTENGFTRIADIKIGEQLEIRYGQQCFGQIVLGNAYALGRNYSNSVLSMHVRCAEPESLWEFMRGAFQGSARSFVGASAAQDVSALLLNMGYPHTINGTVVTFTPEQYTALKNKQPSVGTIKTKVVHLRDKGLMETYDFTLPETHQFITAGFLSHNSGKSHTVGTYLFPYLMHRLLKLQKPAQFYGLSRTTMLQGTFAALTYTQAKDTLWTPFFGAITQTRWYKEYHSMLKHYEGVYGETLFKLSDTFVDYRVRGLQCVIGTTLVETETGKIPIRDVQLGDKLKSIDGYARVDAWHHNGKKDVWTIRTENGFELTATADHPILCKVDDQPEWVHLSKLNVGDFIGVESNREGVTVLLDQLVSIEYAGYQDVYDITLGNEDHAFIGNGIIQHNCFPMGPDKRVMRGRTRFGFSIDEIGYFNAERDTGKVRIDAFEVYDALANSLATVRTAADALIERGLDDVLPAYAMNVSSPTSKSDMIHVLLNRAAGSKSMYGIHRATWEVNPNFKRNSTFIMEAYRKDPESAEKNFAANPPTIANPFISNHTTIRNCEDTSRKNAVSLDMIYKTSKIVGQSYLYGKIKKVKKSRKASVIAIDAGISDNSFSIVGGTTDTVNLSIDFVAEIIPQPGYKLNHSLIYEEVIKPLMEARNCKVLLADRWNSLKLLSDAEMDMGDPEADVPTFIAKQHSLKYTDLVGVRTRMEQGYISFPKSEIKVKELPEALDSDYREFYQDKPVAHMFKQCFTVKDNIRSVDKGDGYTDDNFRAMALCVWGLQVEEFQLLLMEESIESLGAPRGAIAASKLASGGGTTAGNAIGGQTMINGAPIIAMVQGRK